MYRSLLFAVASLCIPLGLAAAAPPDAASAESAASGKASAPPNVLIVTVDDMSADSLGTFGCELPGTSPHIDRFAKEALRFKHAHVQVGNCMPGRNIMWSGMFAHANGVEGFVQNKEADYPVLCDLAQQAGYFAAIRGKVSHSTPYHPYDWDAVLDTSADGKRHHNKDASSYGESTRDGIAMARKADKPFCLLVNISDPHKPFYAQGRRGETVDDPHVPSRVFNADEVPVPGFLPEDQVIRKELAHYYSSVRRADDCFAAIMEALEQSGESDNTFVMFLSDHGMPLPFAKTQLYHHSTHTPLIVRWPGVTEAGEVDDHHMVSAVDFIPTLLDVMQQKHPEPKRLHGRSFASLLRGETQADRDHVVLQYNENAGRNRHPMRGIHTRKYLYLYNPWSDGERKFATATTGTMTYRQMVQRAANEPAIRERLDLFDHRVVEELYDIQNDPDCLNNLIGDPQFASVHRELRNKLADELERVDDPLAPVVAAQDDRALREAYMKAEDERARQAKQRRNKRSSQNRPPKRDDLIEIKLPEHARAGQPWEVTVKHSLPKQMGVEKLHVTLKAASMQDENLNQRLKRIVKEVKGNGETSFLFHLPRQLPSGAVSVAAFVGEDFQSHRQHLQSKRVEVTGLKPTAK